MSFPPGQQPPLHWQQQQQQQQQGTASVPPPPPPRMDDGLTNVPNNNNRNSMSGINNGRRNDRANTQFNRSRKLNIHLTPLDAYGPSAGAAAAALTSTSSTSEQTDMTNFAIRDPRDPRNNAMNASSTLAPVIAASVIAKVPSADPRAASMSHDVGGGLKVIQASDILNNNNNKNNSDPEVKRNRPDPRLHMNEAAAVSMNKIVKDVEVSKNIPKNDPRFAMQQTSNVFSNADLLSSNSNNGKENRMNPLLAASQKQQQQPQAQQGNSQSQVVKSVSHSPQVKIEEIRIPRRQAQLQQQQQSQYPIHHRRQKPPPVQQQQQQLQHQHQQSSKQGQSRPPPPPPPKPNQSNYQRRQQQNMNVNQNPPFNNFGSSQNRPPPPPPPPKPNHIPPPPPPSFQSGGGPVHLHPNIGQVPYPQHQQQLHQAYGGPPGNNNHQRMLGSIPPPPPPPMSLSGGGGPPPPNYQGQGAPSNFQSPAPKVPMGGGGLNVNPNNMNGNGSLRPPPFNAPFPIPPPPPPPRNSGPPPNPKMMNNNNSRPMQQGSGVVGSQQYLHSKHPNVPGGGPHPGGGLYSPPMQQHPQQQQQQPYGISPGQAPPPGQMSFNSSAPKQQQPQQQQPISNRFPPPIISTAPSQQQPHHHHQTPIMDPNRPSTLQQQNPPPGFPSYNRAQTHVASSQMIMNPQTQATSRPLQMHQQQPSSMMDTMSSPSQLLQRQQQQHAQGQIAHTQPQPQQQHQATPKQPKSPWTEHTAPSGIKYYYNSITKESTYSKPENFEGPSAKAAKQNKVSSSESSTGASQTKSKWKEYVDASSGKKYYSDGKTTSWEKPAHFVSSESTSKSPKKRSSNSLVSPENNTSKPKKLKRRSSSEHGQSYHPKKEPTYANKEEAIAAFKGLLLAKGISPSMKWADVFKLCSEDYRWSACKTLGERKQALAEYQTKRANEEKEMRRQEIKRAKDAFHQLMTDMLPRLGLTPNSRFGECRDKLAKDDRFFAVEDEETREELFYDFVEEMRKREERVNRAKKKAARDAFWSFMKEKEESGLLTFASTWSSFKSSLDEKSASDPRFAISSCFVDADRQLMFADYVIDLQAAEDEKRRRIRKARLDAEKAQRDAYRLFLRARAKEGKITIVTRWRNIEEIASKDPTFIPVKEQDHDAPRMIFEDFVDDMKDRYRKDKHFLSRLVSPTRIFPTGIVVGKNTEYDEFCENVLKAAGKEHENECKKILNREPISSARWFFNELHLRAKNAVAAAYGVSPAGYSGRKNPSSRMASAKDESEDEGEIMEDGEVTEY